jgi:hypothetical protein
MALAALIVSVLAAVASVAAVAVAIWTHKQQGSRIECRWTNAFPVWDGHMGEWHISVEAVNLGRSAATISGWGFVTLDLRGKPTNSRIVSMVPPPAWQPQLPLRLDGESSGSWLMHVDELKATLLQHGSPTTRIKAYVQTGTGRMVVSKKMVQELK